MTQPSVDFIKNLIKAQGLFPPVKKTKTNGAYKGATYADLENLLSAVCPVLRECGFLLTQKLETRVADGVPYVVITSTLYYLDGTSLFSEYLVGFDENPQKQGGRITYGRRYDIQCLLGLTTEPDDDGNFVSGVNVQSTSGTFTPPSAPRSGGLRKVV